MPADEECTGAGNQKAIVIIGDYGSSLFFIQNNAGIDLVQDVIEIFFVLFEPLINK